MATPDIFEDVFGEMFFGAKPKREIRPTSRTEEELKRDYEEAVFDLRSRKMHEAFSKIFYAADREHALAFVNAVEKCIEAKAVLDPDTKRHRLSVGLSFISTMPGKVYGDHTTNLDDFKAQLEKMPDAIDKHLNSKGEFDLMTQHP